jgi:hypothetical protein
MPFCGGEKMTPAWAQRQADLLSDCIVSPDVFDYMVDRLCDFVVPYQHTLETEAGKRHLHLYLAGLLSHLNRKNAEKIAALVDVERQVIQEFMSRLASLLRLCKTTTHGCCARQHPACAVQAL